MGESGPQRHILMEMISPLTGMRLKTWQRSRRPSSLASGRASTTARVTTSVERSYRINLTVSTSTRPSLFKRDYSPIVIPRGRRSDKKSETTEGEKRQLRAVWGSVNWVQQESRLDVSALASLGMGSLNHSTVQDLCDANMAVQRLESRTFSPFRTFPGLLPPRITVKELSWLVQIYEDRGTTFHPPLLC